MRNRVGGGMTPPYERKVLGLTAYYSGWADHWALRMFMNSSPVMVSFS